MDDLTDSSLDPLGLDGLISSPSPTIATQPTSTSSTSSLTSLLGSLGSLFGAATTTAAKPATTATAATSSNVLIYAGLALVGILVLIFALGRK